MKKSVFKNPEKQRQVEALGYAQFPMLGAAKVAELRELLIPLLSDGPKGPVSFLSELDDPDFAEELYQQITTSIRTELKQHFKDFKIQFSTCVVKRPDPQGFTDPHQDPTMVDEPENYSLNIWIPLCDVDIDSSAIGLIEGSQHFLDFPRATPTPYFHPPLLDWPREFWPYMKAVPMKAGAALVFDNRNTIEYLGLWETLNNPDFKPLEFEGFKKQVGLNAFTLSSLKIGQY